MIAESGVEAAVARYEELRAENYGGFSYNFEPGVLGNLGERLFASGETAAAVRILELEIEHYPEFAYGRYLLGRAYVSAVSLATPEQGSLSSREPSSS